MTTNCLSSMNMAQKPNWWFRQRVTYMGEGKWQNSEAQSAFSSDRKQHILQVLELK